MKFYFLGGLGFEGGGGGWGGRKHVFILLQRFGGFILYEYISLLMQSKISFRIS